jgi:phosphoglycolate phosphatase
MPAAPALILFDIDGTLLRRAGPAHREALELALLRETGRTATTAHIPVQGMLDGDILRWMMKDAGLKSREISSALPAVMERAQHIYQRRCPDLRDKVCPGVRSLLARLNRGGAVCGLVTGNLSRIGWKKMRSAGLRDYFRFGAFAERGRTRAELARLAMREARQAGWVERRGPVALIGDHPNDIAAARANGIRSVAVATGLVPIDELARHGPDILLEDLRQLRPNSLWL